MLYLVLLSAGIFLLQDVDRTRYARWLASTTASGLGLVGLHPATHGTMVMSPRFSMKVVEECDGIALALMAVLAVMIAPVSWRARAGGIVGAAILTQVANLCRLVTMFMVGLYAPRYFDVVHEIIWQVLLIVFAGLLYCEWLRRCSMGAERGR